MKKLLKGNGIETERKRGTVVKTPCLALQDLVVYLGEMRNKERRDEE
jgi:hypothetical protein